MEPLESLDAPVLPRPPGYPVPLTEPQLRIWHELLGQGTRLSNVRMIVTSVRILGALNVPTLRQSIENVLQRHESLRTRIVSIDGTPRQQIDANCVPRLAVVDLTHLPPNNMEAEAKRLAQEFVEAQINVSVGPLFEGRLLRLSDLEHILFLGLDHIVCDGTSNAILCREIWTLYNQAARAQRFSLPLLPVQFADYAVWQQRTSDAWLRKHDAYWRGRLADAPHLKCPRDHGLKHLHRPNVSMLGMSLGKTLTRWLRAAARREQSPLSSVVLTIIVAVMSRWCNQDDFIFSFASHGRNRPELANMVGYLANHLHIRISMSKEDKLNDLLMRINTELHAAQKHADYGRVPTLYLKGSPPPVFTWIPAQWSPSESAQKLILNTVKVNGELEIQPFPIRLPLVETDCELLFATSDTADGVILTLVYRSDLFTLRTIECLCQDIRLLAEEFSKNPLSTVASLRLAS